MSRRVEEATAWVYRGIWGVLTGWFRVPSGPPSPPGRLDEESRSFRPSNGFLRYLKLKFWLVLVIVDVAIFAGWLALFVFRPKLAFWLAPVAGAIAVVPDVIAYIAIHLRYDTTWYVFTDRSLRIRRGIWIIHETTITFENIQNVAVNSGPLERYFGIANVTVDTAGGGQAHKEKSSHQAANYHQGLIEGIDNANEIRTQILMRVRRSRSAGLGDEGISAAGWSHAHVALLHEIRDLIAGI
jgi:membrane protein YdbS with pleckstrin-like domain